MIRFKIALTNVFWSEDGIDTRYFESIEAQNTYFDTLTTGLFSPVVNFYMSDNVQTTIVYKDTSGRDGSTLCKCNYAVVLKVDIDENEQETILERRYFFAYPSQDSGSQMKVILSLDDVQTNYFAHKDKIAPCLIKRAHLNRFVEESGVAVGFDGSLGSPLFERENFQNVAKRLSSRTKLNLKMSNNDNFNKWVNDNVLGWVYVYCDHRAYTMLDSETNDVNASITLNQPDMTPQYNSGSDLENILNVFCFPILKSIKQMRFWNGIFGSNATAYTQCNLSGYHVFRDRNNGASYIKSIKFSILPPAFLGNLTEGDGTSSCDFYIDNNGNMNVQGNNALKYRGLTKLRCWQFSNITGNGSGMIQVQTNDSFETETFSIESLHQRYFLKTYVKANEGDNPKLEPKFNNADYYEIRLTNERGQNFVYDLQKLNTDSFVCEYSEALTPDITRSYFRIKGTDGVYIAECSQNLTGLVDSADMSLMVDNDQLSAMLANNKNYYLQNALKIGEKTFAGAVAGGLKGGIPGAVVGGVGGAVGSVIDMGLSIDNMQNAPHQLLNSNGNAYFNTMYSEPGLYIETYDILYNERLIIWKDWVKNGYTYNMVESISGVDNIRKRFNYIEAEVEAITAPISNLEKQRLRQRLSKIRFWNDENLNDFTKNYERWLDN